MYINPEGIVTRDTPKLTYQDLDDKEASVPCYEGKRLYVKSFDLNELIGEYLAKEKGLKTAHYFVYETKKDITYEDRLQLASLEFRDPTKEYYRLETLPSPYRWRSYRPTKILNDNETIQDHILSMIALDYYMMQQDRHTDNYFFERDQDGKLDLGPLYDYTYAFDSDYYEYKKKGPEHFYHPYRNELCSLRGQEDFEEFFHSYPALREKLADMTQVDLGNTINQIEEDFSFKLTPKIKDYYKKEEERSQKVIQKVLH